MKNFFKKVTDKVSNKITQKLADMKAIANAPPIIKEKVRRGVKITSTYHPSGKTSVHYDFDHLRRANEAKSLASKESAKDFGDSLMNSLL
jgi:hypothetical protein